jgi:hypothetical protein
MGKKVRIIVDVTELGRKGGHARAANLSDVELSAAGSKAVNARWEAYYKAHPDKLKAKLEREASKAARGRQPKKGRRR